jgi:GNAT superfamily N-acetyltransferase
MEMPYVKDYDAEPANHPTTWPARFDVAHWGVLTAWVGGKHVGGAVVVADSRIETGARSVGLATLWDIRVVPNRRGDGIGTGLFRAAEGWSRARGALWLKAETQNINVPACRFYARLGCVLGSVDRFAYPNLPDEAQLVWYTTLEHSADTWRP